jgi:hypothetical protein
MSMRTLAKLLLVAAAAVVVPACGSNDRKRTPVITFTSPTPAAVNVPRQPIIYIRFDRDMDPATINTTNFLLDDIGGPITVTVTYNAALFEVRIVPTAALAASTTYQVTILSGALSSEGISVGATQFFQFTTGASADIIRPSFAGATGAINPAQTTIELTWAAATDANLDHYEIYMATTTGAQDLTAAYQTTTAATGVVVTGLVANTAYFFVVRAVDASGNTDLNTVQVTNTTLP